MSTYKHFDKLCCAVLAFTLLLTLLCANLRRFGLDMQEASSMPGYGNKLFDTSYVHTIDIVMNHWEDFIENCKNEEYYSCAVVIDNEAYKNVAIRAKGNTSLTQVESYGNNRYSFKIEFDHYDSATSYHGLDKLCLNNIIQDNTYMKDCLTLQMMGQMGVASPLCSYVNITVNGENLGLYLAIEGVEEAFLQREFGSDYGNLYKPDSMNMGGGRGNGEKFDMDGFFSQQESSGLRDIDPRQNRQMDTESLPLLGASAPPTAHRNTEEIRTEQAPFEMQEGNRGGMGGMMKGSDDVLLNYIDDAFDSYSNIFDNAKTKISDNDKTRLIASLKKLSAGESLSDTVDMEAVIRYFTVHNFVLNFDSYTGSMIHNYYLYEKDGQLQMIPWDYNLAFGSFNAAADAVRLINYPIDSPVSDGKLEERPMLAWIFANEEYTALYHQYFAEFIAEWFENSRFEKTIDSVSSMIAPYVEKDTSKFCTYEEFKMGVSSLKEFCLLRAESVKGQLNGTIGSAETTQDSDTFINAGNLQISDMGTMHNARGGGFGFEKPDSRFSKLPQNQPFDGGQLLKQPEPGEALDASSQNDDAIPVFGTITQMPRNENGKFDAAEQGNAPAPSKSPAFTLVWLSISVIVLAFGIVFVIKFERRR